MLIVTLKIIVAVLKAKITMVLWSFFRCCETCLSCTTPSLFFTTLHAWWPLSRRVEQISLRLHWDTFHWSHVRERWVTHISYSLPKSALQKPSWHSKIIFQIQHKVTTTKKWKRHFISHIKTLWKYLLKLFYILNRIK